MLNKISRRTRIVLSYISLIIGVILSLLSNAQVCYAEEVNTNITSIVFSDANILGNNSGFFEDLDSENISSFTIQLFPLVSKRCFPVINIDNCINFKGAIKVHSVEENKTHDIGITLRLNAVKNLMNLTLIKGECEGYKRPIKFSIDSAFKPHEKGGILSMLPIIGYFFSSGAKALTNSDKNVLYLNSEKSVQKLNTGETSQFYLSSSNPVLVAITSNKEKIDLINICSSEKGVKNVSVLNTGDKLSTIIKLENPDSEIKLSKRIINYKVKDVKDYLGEGFYRKIFGIRTHAVLSSTEQINKLVKNDSLSYILVFQSLMVIFYLIILLLCLRLFAKGGENLLSVLTTSVKKPLNDNNSEVKKYLTILLSIPEIYLLYEIFSTFSSVLLFGEMLDPLPFFGQSISSIDATNILSFLPLIIGSFKLSLSRAFMIFGALIGSIQEQNTSNGQRAIGFIMILIFLPARDGIIGQNILLGLFLLQKQLFRTIIEHLVKKCL